MKKQNFNFDDMDMDKYLAYGDKKGAEIDTDLEDFINDDPELRELMNSPPQKSKKKKNHDDDNCKH